MGPGSTPWLPVVEVYLAGETDGMPWVVSVWGTALFPAWVLVQQESVGLNLVPACKTLLIFGGVH